MKLLRQFDCEIEAEQLALRLRSRGIMTHVSASSTRHLGVHNTGTRSLGVWAVLDAQHDDAQALLENPDHTVSRPLDEAEMQTLAQSMEQKVGSNLDKLLNFFAIATVVVGLVVTAYVLLSE